MRVEAFKLGSFTQNISGGNPAGVVVEAEGLTEQQMQQLAGIIGYSETAFVTKSSLADFKVRFFTPCAEVDLCGHATIATFSLMKQKGLVSEGEYTQETKAGILKIVIKGDTVYMQQANPQFFECIDPAELLSCLGVHHEDFDAQLPIQVVSTGLRDIFVPLKDEKTLRDLKPDMEEITKISQKYSASGIHAFVLAPQGNRVATCRNFAPLYGIPEESATGTSNGALACYLQKHGVLMNPEKEMFFEQGTYMNKPSVIKAKLILKQDAVSEVWVGGEAVLLSKEIYEI